jgi:hypothetical protein
MPMSEYEERRWRELEAQLAQERRLVALARRVGSVRTEPSHLTGSLVLVGVALIAVGLTRSRREHTDDREWQAPPPRL